MNLQEQIKTIDNLIKEDKDATIQDFVNLMIEVTGIEMFSCEPMPSPIALREIKIAQRKSILTRKKY